MSFPKSIGVLAILGCVGLAAFTVDNTSAWARSGANLGAPPHGQPVSTHFDSTGGPGFRRSAAVAAALPTAPVGWIAVTGDADHDGVRYIRKLIRKQSLDHDNQMSQATGGAFDPVELPPEDAAFWHAFSSKKSMAYRNPQGVIGLTVNARARRIAHPNRPDHLNSINSAPAPAEYRHKHATYRRVTWFELHGAAETAESRIRPNRLRVFKAGLGTFTLVVTARAPDHHIERFLRTIDLADLRALSRAPGHRLPRALPAKMAMAVTE